MVNFKHSEGTSCLQGFEKKFYDAIEQIGNIVCEVTDSKLKEIISEYIGDNTSVLVVTAFIDVSQLFESERIDIKRFGLLLCEHFPAFFTPAHYRPYLSVNCLYDSENDANICIVGMYSGGV